MQKSMPGHQSVDQDTVVKDELETSESDKYHISGRLDVQKRLAKIAAEADVKNRKIARTLNDASFIYALYAGLDALNLSYTTYKYSVDVYLTNKGASSSDTMHKWLTTPTGASIAVAESLVLISLAILANYFSENDANKAKRYIAIAWPYCRDVLKALKNTYKGTANSIKMLNLLTGKNFNPFILPVAIALSGILITNRIWSRKMITARKNMMQNNMALLTDILLMAALTEEQCQLFRQKVQLQAMETRVKAYISVALSSTIDSLYLYMGMLTIAPVAWPLFVTLSACCVLYTIMTLATRLYDEYEYQCKLKITQARIELALFGKQQTEQIIDNLRKLMAFQAQINQQLAAPEQEEVDDIRKQQDDLLALISMQKKTLAEKREHALELMTLSHFSAALVGAKNGMAAYGALSSILFMAATILALSSTPFPPILLISIVLIGLACLTVFIIHAVIQNHQQRKQQKQEESPFDKISLAAINDTLADLEKLGMQEDATQVRVILEQEMHVTPVQRYFIVEWFEVVRSFFSGLSKGSKAVDYSLNSLQEADAKGHYHDTPVMFAITAFSSLLCAVIWGLRAHARGFGRSRLDELPVDKKADPVISSPGESGVDNDVKPASPPPVSAFCSFKNNVSSFFHQFPRITTPHYQPEEYEMTEFAAP